MNEADRAIVRACLDQMELGMTEAREVRTWWTVLSPTNRIVWKDFTATVSMLRRALDEKVVIEHIE